MLHALLNVLQSAHLLFVFHRINQSNSLYSIESKEQFLNAYKVFSHGRSPRVLLQTMGALHNPRQRRKKEEVCINNYCKCCFILKKKLMNLKSMMDLNMSWVLPLLSFLFVS